ncbi:MAG: lytic transglycosylase domain-containing protein [Bacteroidales bacterium]|jgi:hypothetical protein|nr:lytic transglycosylase domain-containing protein [Bacteroidales bacterium]
MPKMKIRFVAVAGLLLLIIAVGCFYAFSSSSASSGGLECMYGDSLSVRLSGSPAFPKEVAFAGEQMPLRFFDVRESLERELIVNANFHSNTLQYLKRSHRYFPVIEPLLAENGIPDDFKYLSLIESDFLNRVSPKGASGFWQFMKDAAIEYGLEINAEVDERYHLEKSTVAACKYLNEAYKLFGNWTMAAASYNMGKAGLSKQAKQQQSDSYYDLLLNEETMRYLYRITAVKLILENPEVYGFHVPEEEKYQPVPFTEAEVKTAIGDWAQFAAEHNTNYKILKLLNPWLRDNKLVNAARKTYIVKIPAAEIRQSLTADNCQ